MSGTGLRTFAAGSQPPTTNKLPEAPSTLWRWFPAAVWLPRYPWGKFAVPDLIAAISLAALLVPESMGYATVAGVPVQVGLYAAPLGLVGYELFGGSRLAVFAAAGSVAASRRALSAGSPRRTRTRRWPSPRPSRASFCAESRAAPRCNTRGPQNRCSRSSSVEPRPSARQRAESKSRTCTSRVASGQVGRPVTSERSAWADPKRVRESTRGRPGIRPEQAAAV